MKQITILSFLLCAALIAKSQSVPDSGFEVWDTVSGTSYTEPQGWSTSDEQTGALGGIGVLRSNDAHSGNYAAEVRTVYIGVSPGTPYAGLLTNGTFINSGQNIVGGSPFNYLPDTVYFWYKYSAPAFDSALVIATFLHHNVQGGRDTVGYAVTLVGNDTSYIQAAVPVIKHDTIHNVTDSVLFVFLSCRDATLPDSGQLLVDDISFGGVYTGITEVQQEAAAIHIFPNPANDYVNIQTTGNRLLISSTTIYTVDGKQMMTSENKLPTGQLKMNTSELAPGNYLVSIELADGTSARQLINITR